MIPFSWVASSSARPMPARLSFCQRQALHDQTLFHALPLHRTPRRVQPKMNLFLTRLPTSNPSSFLPVDRKDVNNYKLTTNEKEENMKTLIAIRSEEHTSELQSPCNLV